MEGKGAARGAPNCGCKVRVMMREEGVWEPGGPTFGVNAPEVAGARIVYCATHEAAFRLADFLNDEVMPRYVEMFEAAGLGAASESVVVEQARALLREIGR